MKRWKVRAKTRPGRLQPRFEFVGLGCGFRGELNQVQVTTIHGLCLRLLQPHAAVVDLGRDYRVLNAEEQVLLLSQESEAVFGPDKDILSRSGWGEWRPRSY